MNIMNPNGFERLRDGSSLISSKQSTCVRHMFAATCVSLSEHWILAQKPALFPRYYRRHVVDKLHRFRRLVTRFMQ